LLKNLTCFGFVSACLLASLAASCYLLSFHQSTISGQLIGLFFAECFVFSTVLAVAGEDFAIVASDTRLSEGYSIHSRDSPKCYKL
jgi:hypothetical protein